MQVKNLVISIFFIVLLIATTAHGQNGVAPVYGIVACDGAIFIDNAQVENYKGSTNANVQTCTAGADIILFGSAFIQGDASATGSVITFGKAKVEGVISQKQPTSTCDPWGVVSLLKNNRPSGSPVNINLSGNKTQTLVAPGSFYLSGLSLGGNSVLSISGAGSATMFIDGDLSISGQSSFNVSNDVNLTIYITGNIFIDGGGTLSQSPLDRIYASGQKGNLVWICGNSALYGALYAPFSDILVTDNSALIGAVRAMTVLGSGNATFQLAVSPSFGSEIYSFATASTNTPPGACSINANVAAGQRIVVLAMEDGNDYYVSSVTDSEGNSYSQMAYYNNNSPTAFEHCNQSIWSSYVTKPLTAGTDTITITWSPNPALSPATYRAYAISIVTLNNTQPTGQPDSKAQNNAYGYTNSVSIPGTTVAANTVSVGILAANDFVWTIGKGTIYDSQHQNIYYDFFFNVNTSAGPYDPGGTGASGDTYSGVWTALK